MFVFAFSSLTVFNVIREVLVLVGSSSSSKLRFRLLDCDRGDGSMFSASMWMSVVYLVVVGFFGVGVAPTAVNIIQSPGEGSSGRECHTIFLIHQIHLGPGQRLQTRRVESAEGLAGMRHGESGHCRCCC